MILLWLLMYLAPIFVIVAIWTKLIEKTWVKIVVTFISAFALIVTFTLWTTHNDLEECEESVSYLEDLVFDYIREDMAVNTQIDSCEGDYLDQWICMLNVCTESMGVKLRFIEDFHDFLD